jgi:hypothetical protein
LATTQKQLKIQFPAPLGTQCEIVSANKTAQKPLVNDSQLIQLLDSYQDNPELIGHFDRWALQDVFRKIAMYPGFLNEQERQCIEAGHLPRIANCMRSPRGAQIELRHTTQKKVGHYKGLQSCGSIWVCPICAAKITHHRALEIAGACEKWIQEDEKNSMIMVTYTIPHYFSQSIDELLGASHSNDGGKRKCKPRGFKGAKFRLRTQSPLKKDANFKTWKQTKKRFGVHGTITALELTWGVNGHHVHHHDLMFVKGSINDLDIEEMRNNFATAWLHACRRVGVGIDNEENFLKYSVDVARAKTPADYISKWGLIEYEKNRDLASQGWHAGAELSKAHVKHGRPGHYTPWDLARMIKDHPDDARLFMAVGGVISDFMRCFKGSHHIFWDSGLKKYFGVEEISDQEITEKEGESNILGLFDKLEWKQIKELKLRAHILALAPKHTIGEIKKLINSIYCKRFENGNTRVSRLLDNKQTKRIQAGTDRVCKPCCKLGTCTNT